MLRSGRAADRRSGRDRPIRRGSPRSLVAPGRPRLIRRGSCRSPEGGRGPGARSALPRGNRRSRDRSARFPTRCCCLGAGPTIIVNNVRVAIIAFAGGLTVGLLTVYILVANGALLGTAFAVLQPAGLSWTLLTFISGHGVLELSAIVLSGAAGLRFAWAILQPGERTRGTALRLAGVQAMRILLLVIVMLGF